MSELTPLPPKPPIKISDIKNKINSKINKKQGTACTFNMGCDGNLFCSTRVKSDGKNTCQPRSEDYTEYCSNDANYNCKMNSKCHPKKNFCYPKMGTDSVVNWFVENDAKKLKEGLKATAVGGGSKRSKKSKRIKRSKKVSKRSKKVSKRSKKVSKRSKKVSKRSKVSKRK